MKIRYFLVAACLTLLWGCGGGFRGNMGPRDYYHSSMPASEAPVSDESVKFDVPVQVNKQVKNYLVYFSRDRKKVMQRWLARAPRYLPMIKGIFQEYGLPEDLAYLAMIESGFNPNARSPAGAVGMWQFIKGTGRRYGLIIDNYVDERLNPEKSTRAAARYLLDLYKRFGSWYLAAASYNCGEMRVQRELGKGNNRNFWELSANKCLPNETKNYVPQMIAATIIAKNPEKFGFTHIPPEPHQEYRQQVEPAGELAYAGGPRPAPRPHPPVGRWAWSSVKAEEEPPAPAALAHKSRPAAQAYARKSAKKQRHQVHEAEAEADSSHYTASLLGSTHDHHPAKSIKGKKTRHQQLRVADKKKQKKHIQVRAHAGKKTKSHHLAKKHETKIAKAHHRKKKYSSHNHNKEKVAKRKSRPIVVSEAR